MEYYRFSKIKKKKFFGHKLDFHYTFSIQILDFWHENEAKKHFLEWQTLVSFVDISEMRYVRLILNHSVSILSELIDGLNGWLINPSHFSLNSLYSRKIAV